MNHTMFRAYLYIYDDKLVYARRNWFTVREVTMPYTQISSVNLQRGIFFSTLEIYSASGVDDNIKVKHIRKTPAKKAKKLIDTKVYEAQHTMPHKYNKAPGKYEHITESIHEFEKALSRLKELHERGRISTKEFNKKRNKLLHHFK